MRRRVSREGEINYYPVDRFSVLHMASGILLGAMEVKTRWIAALAIGWEVFERLQKRWAPQKVPCPTRDTWSNAVGDVLAVTAGAPLGRWIVRTGCHPEE